MKRVSFDRIAEEYDKTRELPEDVMNKVLDALCEEVPEGSGILDIGSGTARFALQLSRRGFSVVGVDISEKMLGISRRKGFDRLVRADSAFLPFRDAAFDFALAVHVLHLLEDWIVAVAEIRRVLRDSLMSVVIENEAKWFGESYHDLLREHGYDKDHPGIGEKGLAERVKPRLVKEVASVTHHQAADRVIDRLDGRCFSSQWEVPEELHRAVITEMREKYSGEQFENSYDVLVYVWDVGQLDELVTDAR
ncbi:MAG: class I SAM-dependent methyltransferase [Thermoplasmata archaeon]